MVAKILIAWNLLTRQFYVNNDISIAIMLPQDTSKQHKLGTSFLFCDVDLYILSRTVVQRWPVLKSNWFGIHGYFHLVNFHKI